MTLAFLARCIRVTAAGRASVSETTLRCSRFGAKWAGFAGPFAPNPLVRSAGCAYMGEIEDFATAGLGPAYSLSHTVSETEARPAAGALSGLGKAGS